MWYHYNVITQYGRQALRSVCSAISDNTGLVAGVTYNAMKDCFDAITSDTNAAQAMQLMDIDLTSDDNSSATQYMLSILKESFDEMAIESKVCI
jgi:hypothetical protein